MARVCAGVSGPQAYGDVAQPLHRTLLPRRSNCSCSWTSSLCGMSAGTIQGLPLRLAGWKSIRIRPQPPRSTTDYMLRGWPQTKRRRSTWQTWLICRMASSSKSDWGENAYLVQNDRLLVWTAGGYTGQKNRPHDAKVIVLTPKSTVETIRAGYVPEIHPSAVGDDPDSRIWSSLRRRRISPVIWKASSGNHPSSGFTP